MEEDALSKERDEGERTIRQGQEGGKKGKEAHTSKGHGEQATEKPSSFEGECRHCGRYGHKAADRWHKHPKLQGKGNGKLKSKVSELSESVDHQHDDVSWTPASLSQTSGSSSVNTIRDVGCVDEGLWIFSLEGSTKHRQKVSWVEKRPVDYEQVDDHELLFRTK